MTSYKDEPGCRANRESTGIRQYPETSHTGLLPQLGPNGERWSGYRDLEREKMCGEDCLTGTMTLGQGAQPAQDNP